MTTDNQNKNAPVNEELSPHIILALNLADYISLSGKTQNQIAREAGLASSTLSSYMTGQRYPRPQQLVALAQVLGTTPSALTNGRQTGEEQYVPGQQDINDIVSVCMRLTPEDRKTVLEFAEFLDGRHGA